MALSKSGSKKTGKVQMASARDWANKMAEGGKSDFSCLKLPDGFEFYAMEESDVHELDILPYVVGKGNRFADEGFGHYCREYHSHRVPASNGRSKVIACSRETFSKACAVCDWLDKHSQTADKKLVDSLKGKVRFLFNVVDRKEKGRPIRVWDTHYYNRKMGTGELIKEAMDTLPEDVEPFGLENGYTVLLKSVDDSFSGNKFQKVIRVDLRPRKDDYPEDTIHKTACLDKCIVEPDYKAVKSLLERGEGEEEEKEEKEADETFGSREDKGKKDKPKSRKPDPEPEEETREEANDDKEEEEEETEESADDLGIEIGMTVKHKKAGVCEVKKISGDGSSLLLVNAKGEKFPGIAPNTVEIVEEEEEEEEEKPKQGKKPQGKKSAKEEEKEDDDWDD